MDSALVVRNLRKEYPGFALDDLSFELPRGYVMGFIGPNGAGKTTTIKLVMNLLRRDGGSIEVFGMDNIEQERAVKERIGFVYDLNPYYGVLTIAEMVQIVSRFYANWEHQAFARYLDQFELDENQKIETLSRGMKTKFGLAVALSHGAELILMDEPTSGLDPVFRSELLDILYELMEDGEHSIFFSTHITTDLEKIADYITFINNGQLVFSKPKDSVMDNYAMVRGPRQLLDPDVRREFIGIREHSMGFEALTDNVKRTRGLFASEHGVVVEKASLEDIMVYSLRGKDNA